MTGVNLLPGEAAAAAALEDAGNAARTRVRAVLDGDGEHPAFTAEWTRAAALRDIAESFEDYLTHTDGLPADARTVAADAAVVAAATVRRLLAAEAS